MVVRKETIIAPLTTDGMPLEIGQTYVFNAGGRCHAGVYLGIGDRGTIKFLSKIADTDVKFNVMPSSVDSIYRADIRIDKED